MNKLCLDKWTDVVVFIDGKVCITEIVKGLNLTYCHVSGIVTILEQKGIARKLKDGRKCLVELTKEGREVRKAFKIIKYYMYS